MLFYKFVTLILVLLYTFFTVKMTLVLHVYIVSENKHKVVERKTKMLHDVSYFYVVLFGVTAVPILKINLPKSKKELPD